MERVIALAVIYVYIYGPTCRRKDERKALSRHAQGSFNLLTSLLLVSLSTSELVDHQSAPIAHFSNLVSSKLGIQSIAF